VPLGRALLVQGEFTKVLRDFTSEGREPTLAIEIRHLRAGALFGLRQLSEARLAYEEIRKSKPDDARVPLGLLDIRSQHIASE
jgi:hypothetical protein